MNHDHEEVHQFWNRVASDWNLQVGDEGDHNRRLNSDPVLWQFTGDVRGLRILDAGCGTGYLARQLADKGACVTGVDISEKMIEIATQKSLAASQTIDFRLESCATLDSLGDGYFDRVISNYVLMDVPDLRATVSAFYRVLKVGGQAIVVFSHPCFPQGRAVEQNGEVVYKWSNSYFESQKCVDPPWGHFTSEFIRFHRPLSEYWQVFKQSGFEIIDFEEPRITEGRFHLATTERQLKNSQTRPYSIAFKLGKA